MAESIITISWVRQDSVIPIHRPCLGSSQALAEVALALRVCPLGMYFVTYFDMVVGVHRVETKEKIQNLRVGTDRRDLLVLMLVEQVLF